MGNDEKEYNRFSHLDENNQEETFTTGNAQNYYHVFDRNTKKIEENIRETPKGL